MKRGLAGLDRFLNDFIDSAILRLDANRLKLHINPFQDIQCMLTRRNRQRQVLAQKSIIPVSMIGMVLRIL